MTEELKSNYTMALFSRNRAGILNRITAVFSRIKLNIDNLNVSETENKGVYRYSGQWRNGDLQEAQRKMGHEATHYLGTQRVYIGTFIRNNVVRTWTTIRVTYVRN